MDYISCASFCAPRTLNGDKPTELMIRQRFIEHGVTDFLDKILDVAEEFDLDSLVKRTDHRQALTAYAETKTIDDAPAEAIAHTVIDRLLEVLHHKNHTTAHRLTPHLRMFVYLMPHDGREDSTFIRFLEREDFFAKAIPNID